jgi:hypothetical protein
MRTLAISYMVLLSALAYGQKAVEGVRYASHFCTSNKVCDVGQMINDAYADCPRPASLGTNERPGCRIRIPAGAYKFSTPIRCDIKDDPCLIEGEPGAVVELTYVGTGAAITLDWGDSHVTAGGLRDLTLLGPGMGTSVNGVALGGKNGLDEAVLSGLLIEGFRNGIENQFDSFAITIEKSTILKCGNGIDLPVAVESIRISNSTIAQNTTGLNVPVNGVDVYLVNNSFDDNFGQVNAANVQIAGAAIANATSNVHGIFNHFENLGSGTSWYVSNAGGNLLLYGGEMMDDCNSRKPRCAATEPQLASSQGGVLVLDVVAVWSSGRRITQVANLLAPPPSAYLRIINASPALIPAEYNTSMTGARVISEPLRGDGLATTARMANYNLVVSGTISGGSKSFKIDDPLDPANKYLTHTSVESPDMMNIYTGNVTTDQRGLAVVSLPPYFGALNGDFRYQLTPVGQLAQATVVREIKDNQFTIQSSTPRVKVSWQVTGIRHDAYANANRAQAEEDKPPQERGHYLYQELPDAKEPSPVNSTGKAK